MAHDEELADRIRRLLDDEPGVVEKRMFGGLAFLVGGHMTVVANRRGELMARVDPALAPDLVRRPGVARTVMRGREMSGWLDVAPEATAEDSDLADRVKHALAVVRDLPPKAPTR